MPHKVHLARHASNENKRLKLLESSMLKAEKERVLKAK
jgi:hypothetical protein